MNHNLYRFSGRYHCNTCVWSWQSKPRSECPGVRRYDWGDKPRHLLSPTQLGLAGFKRRTEQQAQGMVQSADGKHWTWLYDINEAESKKPGRSPQKGLEILAQKLTLKEQLRWEKVQWKALNHQTNNLLWKLNDISHWLETPERFPFGNEEYWRAGKHQSIKFCARDIRKYIRDCKGTLFKLYPPKRPQPGDAVLGGTQKQPQPYDAVLGGK